MMEFTYTKLLFKLNLYLKLEINILYDALFNDAEVIGFFCKKNLEMECTFLAQTLFGCNENAKKKKMI